MKPAPRHRPEPVETPDKPAPTAMEGHVRWGHKTERKAQALIDGLAEHLSNLHGEGGVSTPATVMPIDAAPGGLDGALVAIELNVDKLLDKLAVLVKKLAKHA